jgi:hypothetical protein
MIHEPKLSQRKCNSSDLILITGGLQCGNCLAHEVSYQKLTLANVKIHTPSNDMIEDAAKAQEVIPADELEEFAKSNRPNKS